MYKLACFISLHIYTVLSTLTIVIMPTLGLWVVFHYKQTFLRRAGEFCIAMSVSVCLSVCLSVRTHITGITCPNFT